MAIKLTNTLVRDLNMSRVVYIKTTESCNLSCSHCFTGGSGSSREEIDVDKVNNWIDKYFKHFNQEFTHFDFHGGEPFNVPLFKIKKITNKIKEHDKNLFTIGAFTNLTYKLNDELEEFIINELDSIGTSWDVDIRFANKKQEDLWSKNLKRLIDKGKSITLSISLSKSTISMDIEKLLLFIKNTGCDKVLFERITFDGNADKNRSFIPTNEEIDLWIYDLHEVSEKMGARHWFENTLLESVYAKFEQGITDSSTFYRKCEENLFTINANGTIAGCPNSAPTSSYADLDSSFIDLLNNNDRLDIISKERMRDERCYHCPVFDVCGSDCHKLNWNDTHCPAPKTLMLKLSGKDFTIIKKKSPKVIFMVKG